MGLIIIAVAATFIIRVLHVSAKASAQKRARRAAVRVPTAARNCTYLPKGVTR